MQTVIVKKVIVKEKERGIGFLGLLTIVFIALKLMEYIEWGWIWVVSPLWVPIALAIAIVLFILIASIIIVLVKETVLYVQRKLR